MTLPIPHARLPVSLHPLIAEAKRRARRRRVLVATAVALAVAAGVGGIVASDSSASSFVPTRPSSAAVQADWAGFNQLTPERTPTPYFGILVFLRNASGETVTLEDLRLELSALSPLRQIGTRWSLFKPSVCGSGQFGCNIPGMFGPPSAGRPFGVERPSPLRIPPGHTAWTQLNFRIVGCTSHSVEESVSLQESTVVYGLPNGSQIRQHAPPAPRHTASNMGGVFGSAAAANAWTGALPGSHLTGTIGKIATYGCHR